MIPLAKENRLSPLVLPCLLGALWERRRLRTSLRGIWREGKWEGHAGCVHTSGCGCLAAWAGGCQAVSVLMGRWQRSDRAYGITASRAVSARAVLLKLEQPAEELGLQLQHSPLMGNLQAAKLHLQQGGMKIPKTGAQQRLLQDKGVSELGNWLMPFPAAGGRGASALGPVPGSPGLFGVTKKTPRAASAHFQPAKP